MICVHTRAHGMREGEVAVQLQDIRERASERGTALARRCHYRVGAVIRERARERASDDVRASSSSYRRHRQEEGKREGGTHGVGSLS